MIARLKGIVDLIDTNRIILDVNGVGYEVFCPNSTIATLQLGNPAVVEVITVVREDSFTLYGFTTALDKQWFEILTSVQGVGAKVGLAIQSVHTSDSLFSAVASGDASAFTQASGVGPKLANRIVLELKDKLSKINFAGDIGSGAVDTAEAAANVSGGDNGVVVDEAVSALINLGYNRSNAFTAVGKVIKDLDGEITVAKIIPLALNELS
ncbi:MAG: Holliday junction branch migration protein RuvA [Alphaproteobacteria bacterium]